jgi:hypothetical protein
MWVHPTLLSMQRVRACVRAGWLAGCARAPFITIALPRAAATASVAHSCKGQIWSLRACRRVAVLTSE